jgi:hypothetical protein
MKVMQTGIAAAWIFQPLPTRCKLFQRFDFRSTHSDPLPLWINFYYLFALRKYLMLVQSRFSNAIALNCRLNVFALTAQEMNSKSCKPGRR